MYAKSGKEASKSTRVSRGIKLFVALGFSQVHLAVLQGLLCEHIFGDATDATGGGESCALILLVSIPQPSVSVH